jgi:hypothetical protein
VRRESAAEANRPEALLSTIGVPAGKECDES